MADNCGIVPKIVKPNSSRTNFSVFTVRSKNSTAKLIPKPTIIPASTPISKLRVLFGEIGVLLTVAFEIMEILSTLSPKTSLTVSLKIVAVVLAKRSASKALVEVATNENINEFSDCTTSIALLISCTVILMP